MPSINYHTSFGRPPSSETRHGAGAGLLPECSRGEDTHGAKPDELTRGVSVVDDQLQFRFQNLHPKAVLNVQFIRMFRVPDDGKLYEIPDGYGPLPVVSIDECRLGATANRRGGVVLPMWPSEAARLTFSSGGFPFVLLVAGGRINALAEEPWTRVPDFEHQNYLVAEEQMDLYGWRLSPTVGVTGTRLDNACNEIDQRCLLRMISSVCWAPTSAKKLAVRSQPRQS